MGMVLVRGSACVKAHQSTACEACPDALQLTWCTGLRCLTLSDIGVCSFGTETYKPVVWLERPVPLYERIALYSVADVAVVTATRDGMNLVPYEYIVSRQGAAVPRFIKVLLELLFDLTLLFVWPVSTLPQQRSLQQPGSCAHLLVLRTVCIPHTLHDQPCLRRMQDANQEADGEQQQQPTTSMVVVSEFVGCSPSVSGAIRVNPWSIDSVRCLGNPSNHGDNACWIRLSNVELRCQQVFAGI